MRAHWHSVEKETPSVFGGVSFWSLPIGQERSDRHRRSDPGGCSEAHSGLPPSNPLHAVVEGALADPNSFRQLDLIFARI